MRTDLRSSTRKCPHGHALRDPMKSTIRSRYNQFGRVGNSNTFCTDIHQSSDLASANATRSRTRRGHMRNTNYLIAEHTLSDCETRMILMWKTNYLTAKHKLSHRRTQIISWRNINVSMHNLNYFTDNTHTHKKYRTTKNKLFPCETRVVVVEHTIAHCTT